MLTPLFVWSIIRSALPASDALTKLSNSSVQMLLLLLKINKFHIKYIMFKHIVLPNLRILKISLGKYSETLQRGSKYRRQVSRSKPGNIGTYADLS